MKQKVFKEIAERFGTPTYVYFEKILREKIKLLKESFFYNPKKILYAMQANFNPSILKIIKEKDLGVTAISPGELALALKVGFPKDDILFTASNERELDFAIKKGVLVNLDSLSLLEKFGKLYPNYPVCVRINSDVRIGSPEYWITSGPKAKFGIWYSETDEIKRLAKTYNLKIIGIHHHIGSGILKVERFRLATEALLAIAIKFEELEFVNLGGGLGIPYRSKEKSVDIKRLGKEISLYFDEFCKTYGRDLRLMIEPGRYIVAEAGYLLVKVISVKRNPNGRVFVEVDSGFNHLISPAFYDSYHRIVNISTTSKETEIVDIVGNLSESGDKFGKERALPLGTKEGDLLLFENVGAYGFSTSSHYNLRERPAEVLVTSDNKIKLIRKRETINTLLNLYYHQNF